MTTFFITGIDTGIGKTLATGLAARYFHRQGKKVITQKLIQTGRNGFISDDILEHRRLMGMLTSVEDAELPEKNSALTCPYSFTYPASAHLAARLENQFINPERISRFTEILQNHYDILFLEGVGGFFVPLTPELLTADYIAHRQYPVILVTSGRMGSINHTLLTIEAIRRRNLTLACLVFNQYPSEEETISRDSLEFFRRICPHIVLMPQIHPERIPDVVFSCLEPLMNA